MAHLAVIGSYKEVLDWQSGLKRYLQNTALQRAGGGFTSNIQDLTRAMLALVNHELLNPAESEEMWRSQRTVEGQETGYGLGFHVSEMHQIRRLEHAGSQTRTRTLMSFEPDQKRGMVLMCNSEWADLEPLRNSLYEILRAPELPS